MNHPEFKSLLQDSGQDFLTLYAEVSLWQDRNNTDLFPTLEQLNYNSVQTLKEVVPEYSQGTDEQIKSFIDTLIPESKVKEVLFHGSTSDKFDKYNPKSGEIETVVDEFRPFTHFGTRQSAIDRIRIKRSNADSLEVERASDLVIPVILNINPKQVEDQGDSSLDWKKVINEAKEEGFDSVSYTNIEEDKNSTSYMTSKSDQVIILNSPETLNKWNNFLSNQVLFQNKDNQPSNVQVNAVKSRDLTARKNFQSYKEAQLKSLLEQAGFNLATLDEYNKATGKDFDVNGLVDFTARTVALSNGANIDALTEEVAHIAVAQSRGSKEYAAAMTMVEETEEYTEYYDQYIREYNDDLFVREEILGKILKKDLEVKLGTSLGSMLRRIWNKFLNIFRNKSLQVYISKITDEFIANPDRPIDETGIMFQLKKEEKLLAGQVSNLKERLRKLRKRGILSKSTMNQIIELESELEGAQNGVGIYKFLGLLENDIQSSLDFISKYFKVKNDEGRLYLGTRTDLDTPSSKNILQLSQFIGYYLPFLRELNSIVGQEASIGEEKKESLDKMIRNQVQVFDILNRAYKQLLLEDGRRTVEESGLEFDLDLLQYAYKDSNFLETWFAPIRYNTDQLLRLTHRLVFDLNQKIRRAVLSWSDDFLSGVDDYIGKDMSWAAEKAQGKSTGYFISPIKRGEWNKAREEFHTTLHDKYGFSQDLTERIQQKKKIIELKDSKYRQTQRFVEGQRKRLKEYNKEIAQWYNYNSTVRPDLDEVIQLRKSSLNSEQYKLWEYLNMELNEDGSVKYYKGELVSPSVGKNKQVFDKVIKTIDWTNPEYKKLSNRELEVLEYLKRKKLEIDQNIPFANPDLLPQMYESTLDILTTLSPDIFSKLKKNIASSVVKEEDDTLFNDSIKLGDGSILDEVPIRFTNLLKEPERVSTNLLSSLIGYKQMQENYAQKSSKLPEFENILQLAKTRKVAGKKETIQGEQSWSFQALKNFLQVHISGQQKDDVEVNVFGTTYSVTKAVEKLSQWVRMKNLGLNFITMTSNLLSAKIFATVESLVGKYTTPKSSAFANKEFFKLLPSVLSTVKDYRSKDRISTLMQYFGLGKDIRELFSDMDKHVLLRNQPDKSLMYGYHVGDYFSKAIVMISVLDNYRVKDNKWYTSKEATKAGVDFNEMTSAYDYLQTADGKVSTTIPDSVIDNLTSRITTLASQVDGSLRAEDKAAIYQHAVFSMVGLHRGWFFEGVARRFKAKGYDYTLQGVTEGQYRTVTDLIGKFFMSKEKLQIIRNLLANFNNLEDYQKENLKRVMIEIGMIAAFTVIALTLNSGDDDEEDYFRDLLAYQSNRVLMEVSSFYNPNEFVSVLRDPIVPARDLELITNFTDLFNREEIEKGKWEGLTKQQKYLLQLVPGIKGYTSISDPESANSLIQHKQLKPLYSTYDFFVGEDEE